MHQFSVVEFDARDGAPLIAERTPMDLPDTGRVLAYFKDLQQRIVAELEAVDGGSFRRDEWTRPAGGGGISRLIEDGELFERGGVNFSHVMGPGMPASATIPASVARRSAAPPARGAPTAARSPGGAGPGKVWATTPPWASRAPPFPAPRRRGACCACRWWWASA